MQTPHYKSPDRTAFCASLLCGCVTHFFALVTVLHNYDDIGSLPGGYGTGTISGRWFLQTLGQFSMKLGLNYNLPFFNGFVFLFLIALSAAFLVRTLHICRTSSSVLIGMLFSVFPTVSSTLFFRFTAIFYGISLLLSILAPYFTEKYRFGWIGAIVLIAFSLGIYQAYVPMTIGLFVLLLIQYTLDSTNSFYILWKRSVFYCMILLSGYLLYYSITQLCLNASGSALLDYQGIQNMGHISVHDLPHLVWKTFKHICTLPLQDYCGITYRQTIKLTYLLLAITAFPLLLRVVKIRIQKTILGVFLFVLLLLFPVAINFIEIMVPDGWIYTLMVYPIVLLPCLPLILLEYLPAYSHKGNTSCRLTLKTAIQSTTLLLVILYSYYDNVNYTALYYENRQVENYVSSMVTQVRMTDGFRPDMQWIMLGEIQDPQLGSMWAEETAYGGNSYALHLLNEFSFSDWIENYVGYNITFANEDTIHSYATREDVIAMPCWPAHGSIQIIEDSVVIKCQDLPKNN